MVLVGGDVESVETLSLLCIYREVMVLITGANKSIALYKAIEEGVCHMWTVSAFQQHPNTMIIVDEVRISLVLLFLYLY